MNFSGVYSLMNMPPGTVVDCRDIRSCDCYCSPESAAAIRKRMGKDPSGIHFIDSGDYHYVTEFWTDRIREPFNLILFDHHPDMHEPEFPDLVSCGGWVQDVLAGNPHCRKVLIIGANPALSREALQALDRIRLIDEKHVMEEAMEDALPFFDRTLPVYISIDKDVLDEEWASTDWDQGSMSLRMLESCLRLVFGRFRVIGVDICGEKPEGKGGTEKDWTLNSLTNKELFLFLQEIWRKGWRKGSGQAV